MANKKGLPKYFRVNLWCGLSGTFSVFLVADNPRIVSLSLKDNSLFFCVAFLLCQENLQIANVCDSWDFILF